MQRGPIINSQVCVVGSLSNRTIWQESVKQFHFFLVALTGQLKSFNTILQSSARKGNKQNRRKCRNVPYTSGGLS